MQQFNIPSRVTPAAETLAHSAVPPQECRGWGGYVLHHNGPQILTLFEREEEYVVESELGIHLSREASAVAVFVNIPAREGVRGGGV